MDVEPGSKSAAVVGPGGEGGGGGAGTSGGRRAWPNILITGTPATGKTTLAERVVETVGEEAVGWGDVAAVGDGAPVRHVNVSNVVKEGGFHEGEDPTFKSLVVDEERLLDHLEGEVGRGCPSGGAVVDFHSSNLFPERWFDLVVVCQANNTVLYDRLAARSYSEVKIKENIECEIFQVPLDEARSAYRADIVWAVPSDTVDDLDGNAASLVAWIHAWAASKPLPPPPSSSSR